MHHYYKVSLLLLAVVFLTASDPSAQQDVGARVGATEEKPTIKIENIKDKGWARTNPELVVKGTATKNWSVMLQIGGVDILKSPVAVDSSGSWIAKIDPSSRAWDPIFLENIDYELSAAARKDGKDGDIHKISFTVDNTDPTIQLGSRPDSPTNSTSWTFTFTAGDPNGGAVATVQCSLDDKPFKACQQNNSHSVVVEPGGHSFVVRVTDRANNFTSSNEFSWTVDIVAPEVKIDKGPDNPTNSLSAVFNFSSDASDVRGFQCALDSLLQGAFKPCSDTEGYTLAAVAPGVHSFYVKAKDLAGNESVPAKYSWLVDMTPPSLKIDEKPAALSNSNVARFEFSSSDSDIALVQCALDSGGTTGFRACSGTMSDQSSVTEGTHDFYVRATDKAGNVSETARYSWKVDLTPPDIRLDSPPDKLTNSKNAVFVFSSLANDVARFECALSKSSDPVFTPCASGTGLDVGAEGEYTFQMRAVDHAGNAGSALVYSWVVDLTAPVVELTSPKESETIKSRTPYIFGTTEALSEVRLRIDGGELIKVSSDKYGAWVARIDASSELAEKRHVITAEATDAARNVSKTPKTVNFFVDATPPKTKIEKSPPKTHYARRSEFSFSSSEDNADFECQLDEASGFTPCPATYVIERLTNGFHTLFVRSVDEAGNIDPSPISYGWTVHVDAPLYPDIVQPVDGSEVNTGTPVISGTAMPNGTVVVVIDGVASAPTPVDPSGLWTFRPTARLEEGRHSLSGETIDTNGNSSDAQSPTVYFKVSLAKEAGLLTGGAGCGAAGARRVDVSVSLWAALLLWAAARRRRA